MSTRQIYRNILRGSFWAISMRWCVRGIGLFSMIILARLLTPEDFGLVAMGSLAAGFVGAFANFGIQQLLIREKTIDDSHCNTAWTFQIGQGLFIATVLWVLAPFAASYFEEARATSIIRFFAVAAVITGFQNIGMVLVRKELDFAKDFRFIVYRRLVRFVVTVGLAIYLRSYWALVFGQIVSSLVGLSLSFGMHHYRPKLSLARAGDYLRFGMAIVPQRVGHFLVQKLDVIAVGRFGSTSTIGEYNIASELSAIFTKEIVVPLARGLLPNYAKIAHDRKRLADTYLTVLGGVASIVFALGCGFFGVSEEFVVGVLGEKWISIVPFARWLVVYGMLLGLLHITTGQILIVIGKERLSAILVWARIAALAPCVVVGGLMFGVDAVAPSAVLSAVIMLPVAVRYLALSLSISIGDVARRLRRPLVSGMVMAGVLLMVDLAALGPVLVVLFVKVILGAAVYGGILLSLWWWAGKPDGLERVLINAISAGIGGRLMSRRAKKSTDS